GPYLADIAGLWGQTPHPSRSRGEGKTVVLRPLPLLTRAPDQFVAKEPKILGVEAADSVAQAIGELGGFRRHAARIDRHLGVGNFGEALQFLCLIPDDIEKGDDAVEEEGGRHAALSVFQRRKVSTGYI